jgi:hypothetical protein
MVDGRPNLITTVLALNRILHRQRRRVLVVATVVATIGAVAVAHTIVCGDHAGEKAAAMCLAVFETGAVVALGALALRQRPRPMAVVGVPHLAAAPVPVLPPSRAGPAATSVLRL